MDFDYVKKWIASDPDEETKTELQLLLDSGDQSTIEQLFSSRLSFGTAGLRAELGPGPMRMNRLVVGQTAKGIADFLKQHKSSYLNPDGLLTAVVGFDARKNSDVFAKDTAEIFQAEGIEVELFDHHVPTPVVAFTARQKRSSVAVVVTASHNPPNDNGYKVYLGGANGGSQIVPPQDTEIAKAIAEVKELNPSNRSDKYKIIGEQEVELYLSRCAELAGEIRKSNLKIVYTAMHGVGWSSMKQIFTAAGFDQVFPVEDQIHPDPNFPTVKFPNPEEPGAMDLALAEAKRVSADLIIANDPDADRLAVGIPQENGFRMLSGNELGILLANFVASRESSGVMAASYVSTQQLAKLAKSMGFENELTPTGFKWIAKVNDLVFGFEEALGYCVDPKNTPDKDGLTAALFASLIARDLAEQNTSIQQHLDEIAAETGFYETGQISIRLESMLQVSQLLDSIRSKSKSQDTIKDLAATDPRLDMLEIRPTEHSRALIRASGTEPKLKCYLEATGDSREVAKEHLRALEVEMKDFLEQ